MNPWLQQLHEEPPLYIDWLLTDAGDFLAANPSSDFARGIKRFCDQLVEAINAELPFPFGDGGTQAEYLALELSRLMGQAEVMALGTTKPSNDKQRTTAAAERLRTRVRAMKAANPKFSNQQIADALGCGKTTVQRHLRST